MFSGARFYMSPKIALEAGYRYSYYRAALTDSSGYEQIDTAPTAGLHLLF